MTQARPVALLFCQALPPDSPLLRSELRGLSAELIALSPAGGVRLSADDPPEELPPSPALWRERGVPPCVPLALFLLDGDAEVRFHQRRAGCGEDEVLSVLAAARLAQHSGFGRRELLAGGLATAGLAFAVSNLACASGPRPASSGAVAPMTSGAPAPMTLHVNGQDHRLLLEPRVTLLDALRERLALTGAKKGCDHGQCGSCTVLADGQRILSCLTLAAQAQRMQITTIEGLAKSPTELHPMQQAFLDHDAFQCGYCTPGQILSAVALVSEGRAHTKDEVRESMSGNLCRCGAYSNIVDAVQSVQGRG